MTTILRSPEGAILRARPENVCPAAPARRLWIAPRLRVLGDLRCLTLGPSPGIGESGNPTLFRT